MVCLVNGYLGDDDDKIMDDPRKSRVVEKDTKVGGLVPLTVGRWRQVRCFFELLTTQICITFPCQT